MDSCDSENFKAGPMAWVVDKLIEKYIDTKQSYEISHINTSRVSFVSEHFLASNRPVSIKKAMDLRGKKKPAETQYYFENARTLAIAAKQKSEEVNDTVIAVLFRDADGTASAGRGNWRDKYASIVKGFAAENYDLGVAMLPNPKSEAWLLCAVKPNAYQHCEALEQESGNDRGANPLKTQLADALNNNASTDQINTLVQADAIDVLRIDMSSYNTFKADLEGAVRLAVGIPE
ncbi:hypothetical protein O59_002484 [Cellvibrio sp. BR]|nr:hypothetical protein O59_002484 [Cellvibrio sp. BR]